jgi:ubiquinone/menaquinone biosynthesis C-methylase UbiE
MGHQSHQSDPRILNRRTLQRDHRRLAQVLRAGTTVLDVGCGTGAITADIAKTVGRGGMVVGLDRDDANLAIARQEHRETDNLRFENGDILTIDFERDFKKGYDIVTAARTLQWISEPSRAVGQMKRAAKLGGCVVILDYNLEDTRWEPDPPADFKRFYRAFLDWRTANHWDNRMAEHLPELFHSAGLTAVEIHSCDEIVQRGESDFFDAYASGIWLYVIQTLGPQLVHGRFLEESERCRAEEDYARYVQTTLQRQTHSMSTVEGRVAA